MNPRAAGFSLIELIIATALTAVVAAGVCVLMPPAQHAFATTSEVIDTQQRLRVAVDALTRDLAAAGGGGDMAGRSGPLIRFFAPVLPSQRALAGGDSSDSARADAITVIAVPATAAQTMLTADWLPGVQTLQAAPAAGCPPATNLCGFSAGMTVAVYGDSGSAGVFVVAAVVDAASQIMVIRPAALSSTAFRSGSHVVEVRLDSYSAKFDAATSSFQLMHADGSPGAGVPVVDHLVKLSFDYYGEPRPPSVAAGRASYGPQPPPHDVQTTAYPPGENCIFQSDPLSGEPVPRLPALAADAALVPLTLAQLSDGPWCPDAADANRWDADLLRIRAIGVTVRLEAAAASLRGPAGALFANPGSSHSPQRWAPDQEIRFQVSPRNLGLGRR